MGVDPKPLYHEILKGGEFGLRIMVLPRLCEFHVPNQNELMSINVRAMKQLGYAVADTGAQNVMHYYEDERRIPVCIDYGVYKFGKQQSFDDLGKLIWVSKDPNKEVAPGVTESGCNWWRLGERFFSEYSIVDRDKRLQEIVRCCKLPQTKFSINSVPDLPTEDPDDVIRFE